MVCTFFGHADASSEVVANLESTLIDLIENKKAKTFYVGNNGNFDTIVRNQLEKLSKSYPIKYFVVLAYMPKTNFNIENTVLPDGIENCPPRFAISYRNKWMIDKADYVVCYVTRSFGGAFKFKEISISKNKYIIELS